MPAHSQQAQTRQAQQQAFSLATNVSNMVGPPTAFALARMDEALPLLEAAQVEMATAKSDLESVIGKINVASAVASAVGAAGIAFVIDSSAPSRLSREALRLLTIYESSLNDITDAVTRIRNRVGQKPFKYRTGTFSHQVKSCADLRAFSSQASNVPTHIRALMSELIGIRQTIYYYGSDAGRQTRNQTKKLMTDVKLYINHLMTLITQIMRSDRAVRSMRNWIDRLNDNRGSNACGYPRRGDSGTYDRCFGLNAAEPLLKYTAAKQGLSWNRYRDKWVGAGRYLRNGLSNSDKDRNIVTAFDEIRSLMKGIRDRQIPAAREEFVNAFAGMKDVLNKATNYFTAAQRAQFGPLALGVMKLTDASMQLNTAYFDALKAEPVMGLVNNPANVQCQSGSGYAGIFSSDDGEPMDPMLILGGGLVAGLAVAHFFPNLLRR